jgi:hypothetical protein
VLGNSGAEKTVIEDAIERAAGAAELFVADGVPAAMNRYNRKTDDGQTEDGTTEDGNDSADN